MHRHSQLRYSSINFTDRHSFRVKRPTRCVGVKLNGINSIKNEFMGHRLQFKRATDCIFIDFFFDRQRITIIVIALPTNQSPAQPIIIKEFHSIFTPSIDIIQFPSPQSLPLNKFSPWLSDGLETMAHHRICILWWLGVWMDGWPQSNCNCRPHRIVCVTHRWQQIN